MNVVTVADPGGVRGGALPKKNEDIFVYNFVVEMCFVNIYIQYKLAKYGLLSASEVI